MSICKRCGQEIEWIYDENGRARPFDAEPVFVIEGDGCDRFITDDGAEIVGRIARPEEERRDLPVAFVPHWKSCGKQKERW